MRYLLDTNACVDFLNGREEVVRRVLAISPDELCTSGVVAAELRYGAAKSAHPKRNHARLDALFGELTCVAFDEASARVAGAIRAQLERAGTPVGPYDTLIAAHALHLEATLVTDNVREFQRIAKLPIENWRKA